VRRGIMPDGYSHWTLPRLVGTGWAAYVLLTGRRVNGIEAAAMGLALRSLEAPLYGYLVLFISTKLIDLVLEGWNYSKLVIIISARTEEIAGFILKGLERGGTALRSRSLYLNREGEVILTVVHRKQLAELRDFIKEIDPQAFVIINDTYDVLGKGFKSTLFT